ncbi:hypothetical protein GQ43DRAFT_380061 [Delitschia confertaspora ATCC 74209]|uniref:dihydroneopterin aldolase n=1 Tax=Delitschia confertaspora ATCC 74209 TaxID=1513339 RepID=A0A9P4MVB2_9PLEO|nr:hypothetical protein GQ43DRAFT_380061 [Delitschia confertaspora ATCC 74209]
MDLVSSAVWKRSALNYTDRITVQNIQVNVHAGADAWGRKRNQPALLSLTVFLAEPFHSAAEADKLDNSTIHYGTLSKTILSYVHEAQSVWLTSNQLALLMIKGIVDTAGSVSIGACSVKVFYPKGSLLGDGAGLQYCLSYSEKAISRTLYLQNVRIPCIIGINANEREAKQPVVVNLWVDHLPQDRSDDYTTLENVVVQFISSSSFETLESLLNKVVDELRRSFFRPSLDDSAIIRLRVDKPMAVPFADAPALEVVRPVKV